MLWLEKLYAYSIIKQDCIASYGHEPISIIGTNPNWYMVSISLLVTAYYPIDPTTGRVIDVQFD